MAGSLVIPNQFQNQSGPIPLSQLDADFTAVVNTVNNTLTYANYYADSSGVANSIIVTIVSPQTFSYTAGQVLFVKVANANSGATTINVNGLGAISVRTSSLAALSSGALVAGGIYPLMYDGTYFQLQTQATSITSGQITAALGYTAGYINIPQNTQGANYTLLATDVGKHINLAAGGVNLNASVFSAGDVVTVFNNSSSSQTITAGTNVTTRLAGTTTTGTGNPAGNRTIANFGLATILCIVGGANPTFVVSGAGVS